MKQIAIVLGIALAFPAAAVANPPQSKAYGKSLSEWMVLYMTWSLGGDQDDQVGRVQFMPLPQGVPVAGTGGRSTTRSCLRANST